MKGIKVFLVLVLSLSFLTSCDLSNIEFTRIGWHDNIGNEMWGKFDYFNGDRSKKIKVKKDETVNIVIDLTVNKGEMYVVIEDNNGNELFRTDKSDTFEYTADSDVKIKEIVYAKGANGSYKISVEKLEEEKNTLTV